MSNIAFTLSANNFHTLFIPEKEVEVEPIVFYGNRVDDIRVQGEVVNTLQARMGTGGGNMPLVAYPIDDGREVEKFQNGSGIGEENAPAYTLDTRQHASVAAFDGYNQTVSDVSQTVRGNKSDGDHVGMILKESIVRRLTPTECERLQGFEDSWTKFDAEGKEQADSHRYKQLGNAVCVNVVQFITDRLVKLHEPNP